MLAADQNDTFAFAITADDKVIGSIGVFRQTNIHNRTADLADGLMGYKDGNSRLKKISIKSPIFTCSDIKPFNTAMNVNAHLMDYLVTYDTSDYTNISIPIYFICGKNDWQVPTVCVESYYNRITAPDKDLFRIENAGHLTDLENPAEYNRELCLICERLAETMIGTPARP